ncbi:unnamed protein product [Phaeothamnion confervicola]
MEFETGNPQLGLLSGSFTYFSPSATAKLAWDGEGMETNASGASVDGEQEGDSVCDSVGRDGGGDSSVGNAGDDWEDGVSFGPADAGAPIALPEPRSALLCLVAVPAHLVPTDILQFVAPFKEAIHLARILRPLGPATSPTGATVAAAAATHYMVLLQMTDQASADAFYLQYHCRQFTSLEEARCQIVFVSSITFDRRCGDTAAAAAAATGGALRAGGVLEACGSGVESKVMPELRVLLVFVCSLSLGRKFPWQRKTDGSSRPL